MNPIYRGQYPPKNTDVLWVKQGQIFLFQNGGWVPVSGGGGSSAEEYLSETSENLIKNKAVYNQYMDEEDTKEVLKIIDPNIDYGTPLTFEFIDDASIAFKAVSSSHTKTIMYKKTTEDTWHSLTSDTGQSASIIGNAGDIIQVKGDNTTYADSSTYINYFTNGMMTGRYKVYGNIMSLIDSTNFKNLKTISSEKAFLRLFRYNTDLVDASGLLLPATTLATYCYGYMFEGCTSLEKAPELPATTLAANCYYSMFYNCSSLIQAPTELPALTLNSDCYGEMFRGCSSLEVAPLLPAQVSVSQCYYGMLRECPKLKEVTCLLTTLSSTNDTNYWLYQSGTSATDPTFKKDSTMSGWTVSDQCIPSNWTIVNA